MQPELNGKEKVYEYKARDHIVEIYSSNLKCLTPEKYLGDSVIRFFMAYLLKDVVNPQTAKTIHVFDSLFHTKLSETFTSTTRKNGQEEEKIKKWRQLHKWFRGVNLFEKSFLVFPICQEEHWFAVIVCYPGEVADLDQSELSMSPEPYIDLTEGPKPLPGIIVMDSLGLNNRMITKEIREFLDLEWRTRLTTIKDFSHHSMPQFHPRLPTQKNAFDCGIFTLAYLKAFALMPDKFYLHVRENSPASKDDKKELPKPLLDVIDNALKDCSRESLQSLIQKVCQTR